MNCCQDHVIDLGNVLRIALDDCIMFWHGEYRKVYSTSIIFNPDGFLFVVYDERASYGRRDGRGWYVSQPRA